MSHILRQAIIQSHVHDSPEAPDHIPLQKNWVHTLIPQLPKLSTVMSEL
jgi:hypothetical protein